jgi:putative spermidine/putrescine transport system substrate-binding protein
MKTGTVMAIGVAVFIGLAVLFGALFMSRTKPVLTVATWPESYGHAQATAQLVPFGNASGTNVLIAVYDGGTTELAHQVASHHYRWDVIDMELPDAVSACAQGLLEPVDASALPASPNGMPAAEDFVPGAIGPCWVASMVYAQVIAVAPTNFADKTPTTSADFFDLKAFPGKRALSAASGKYNLEMALLADGVASKDVYAMLSTAQGVTRALNKLQSIRSEIVWYRGAADAAKMLTDGRAAMALLPNWAVFDADNDPAARFKLPIIWDRQLYELEVFGIPKGNPKAPKAADFVRFATRSENLGRMASWIAYGPARRSGLSYVGTNPDLRIAMAPYLPTAHFDTAFAIDDVWWRLHGADIAVLWQSFTDKTP